MANNQEEIEKLGHQLEIAELKAQLAEAKARQSEASLRSRKANIELQQLIDDQRK